MKIGMACRPYWQLKAGISPLGEDKSGSMIHGSMPRWNGHLVWFFITIERNRHRNPPGQGYPTGVLTLPYSGSQGQRSLLTRPVTLPGSGQGTLQGRIEVETV